MAELVKHHNVTSPKSCQVTREPATLIALIAVKPDYPRRAPVFCLNLHWDGEHNVHNSENIRVSGALICDIRGIRTGGMELAEKHEQPCLKIA